MLLVERRCTAVWVFEVSSAVGIGTCAERVPLALLNEDAIAEGRGRKRNVRCSQKRGEGGKGRERRRILYPLFHAKELEDMEVHSLSVVCNLTSTIVANGRRLSAYRGSSKAPFSPLRYSISTSTGYYGDFAQFGSHISLLLEVILAYADDIKMFAKSYDEDAA